VLNNVQTNNAGTYRVVVTNAIGMITSDPAALGFTELPNITQQPQDMVIFEGSNATFRVTHCLTSGPFGYQWCFESAASGEVVELAGETNATLTLSSVDFDNAGLYSVIITNLHGEAVSEPAELSVSVLFHTNMVSSTPLIFDITFDTDDDGLIYSVERQDPDDPHNWIILAEPIGDGTEKTHRDDLIPEEITTPIYRVVRRPEL